MADGDIKIKDLSAALQIDDSAEFVYTQDNGGTNTTFKAPVNQIARKIAEGTTYTNLETTAKTLVGAINELSHLGNPIIIGTTAPASSQGANGNIYIQYTAGTGGADDTVDGMFIKINGAWCEISTGGGGGSGGHTIVDNGGTSLTQRTNLQFNGAYSEDNSTDDTTEVNVVRSMTRAEFDLLSADEKTGLINITDEISGGLKYVKETLYSNIDESNWTAQSSGATLTLTDNILDYDEVYFESAFWETQNTSGKKLTHFATSLITRDTIKIAFEKSGSATYDGMFDVCPVLISANQTYTFNLSLQVPTETTLKIQSKYVGGWDSNKWGITRIIGIKYLSDSEHTYSEDEHIVGTWIDGKTLYEKTVTTGGSVPTGATLIERIVQTGYDTIRYTKT